MLLLLSLCGPSGWAQISIPNTSPLPTETFSTLATTGTSSTVPAGWAFVEAGMNANGTYTVQAGANGTGDTQSLGAVSGADRSFGGLRSGNVIPTIGAAFTNNTGATITSLAISYQGETWRIGSTGRADRLDFQYSTNATSLTTGTWVDENTLDYTNTSSGSTSIANVASPVQTAAISSSISSLSIANGATFWIRWSDFDASGADDAMGVDDFVLTATTAASNTLTLGTVTGFPACVTTTTGASVSVGYTSAGAGFTTGTTYTAELSDASGNFPGTAIGTLTGAAVGANSISATVPAGTASSALYKVRVTSTTPTATSGSSSAVTVRLAPTNYSVGVTGTNPQTFASNSSGSLLTAAATGFTPAGASTDVTYQWKYGTTMGGPYTSTIASATSATYTPQGADFAAGAADTYYLIAEATSVCGSLVRSSSEITITTTAAPSAASDVVFNSGFAYNTTGIDYAAKQNATITNNFNANSEAIYSVTVRDGGATMNDADALPTIVSSLTFSSVQGIGSIRTAALFNGSTLVSNAPVINTGAGTIAFTGLSFSVADNTSENLTLRVTFNTTASDAQQLRVTLTRANTVAAASGSSGFASFTTLSSTNVAGLNEINVIGDRLRYNPAPPTTAGVNVDLTVGVEATDVNNNRDTDFRGGSVPSVTLTRGAGTGTFTAASGLTKVLTSGLATWTDLRYDVVENGVTLLTTNTGGLTNASATINFLAFAGILWDGGAGTTSWFDANNWSTNTVPTAADDVRLDNSAISGSYTVAIPTAGAVARSLQVGGTGVTGTITLNISATSTLEVLRIGGGSLPALAIAQGGLVNNTAVTGGGGQSIEFVSLADTWVMTGNGQYIQGSPSFPSIEFGNTTFASTTTFEVLSGAATNWSIDGLSRVKNYGNLTVTNVTTITLGSGLLPIDSVIVAGNMIHNGGLLRIANSGTDQLRVRVKGNLVINSGTLRVSEGGGSTANELIVEGNVTATGTLSGTAASGDLGRVVVGGSFTGGYSASGTGDNIFFRAVGGNTAVSVLTLTSGSFRNITIQKEVRLGASFGITGTSASATVAATGILDFNGFNVTGSGTFTLSSGGTLKITSTAGVNAGSGVTTGNVLSTGTRTFSQTATYWYTGTAPQGTGNAITTGSTQKILIIDNPTTVTLANSTGISGPGGRLDIRQGTLVETLTAEISGSGNLVMTGGTYLIVKTGATLLPQLTGTYTLTGGTVELGGAGNQVLRGGMTYYSLTFSGGGTKTLSSSVSNLAGVVTITGATTIVDLASNTLEGTGALTMTDGRLRTAASGTRPGLTGVYTMTGGTVEFAGSNLTAQTIRGNDVAVPNRTYFNIEVTGTNVMTSNADFAVTGTFTVKTGGVFEFSTLRKVTGAGNFLLEPGSTLYYGSGQGIDATGATGNVQVTGTITFPTTASYGFRGGVSMITGSGLPASVVNLTVDKTSAANTITLTNPVTVNGVLTLTQGIVVIGNNDLTVSSTGSLVGGSAASFIRTTNATGATGELIRFVPNTSTSVLFPVGNVDYTPATLNQVPAGASESFAVRVFSAVRKEGNTGAVIPDHVVNRTWVVNQVGAAAVNATLTLQWNGANETMSFDRTQARISSYQAGAYDFPPVAAGASGTDPYTVSRSGLNAFSFFTVVDGNNVLPVELVRFDAQPTTAGVKLTWATASERENDYFEVERAINQSGYVVIGKVMGHGTTMQPHEYTLLDNKVTSAGTLYYRLRQVDYDGTVHYSPVQTVVWTGGVQGPALAGLYPNPVASVLTLQLSPEAVGGVVRIQDALGRIVLTQALAANATEPKLDLRTLPVGTYHLTLTTPAGLSQHQTFVRVAGSE